MPDIPLAGGFYKDASLPISAQDCINFIPDVPQTNTFTGSTLGGTPGILEQVEAGTNEINRGGWHLNDKPYFVEGQKLFRIDRTFDANSDPVYAFTQVGTGLTGTQQVILKENSSQLIILIPELDIQLNAFIFTEAGGLVQISDTDFNGPASSVDYVDGVFSFTKKDSNIIFISAVEDGFTYDATDQETALISPDNNVGQFVLNNQWFVGGSRTIQSFQNVGGSDFPFITIPGQVQQKGFSSQFAVVEMGGRMVYLGKGEGEQPAIWASDGGQPQKLSNTAIDNEISTFSDTVISQAFAMKSGQAGNYRVFFTFPGETTFVYQQENGIWSTVESIKNELTIPYRVQSIVDAYGELWAGDMLTPKIGTIDPDQFLEFGEIMRRSVTLFPVDNDGQPFFMDALELLIEAGTNSLNAEDAKVFMSFSLDGGKTFNLPIGLSMGLTGQGRQRLIWTQLGQVDRNVVFRFEVDDPIKISFIKCDLWLS